MSSCMRQWTLIGLSIFRIVNLLKTVTMVRTAGLVPLQATFLISNTAWLSRLDICHECCSHQRVGGGGVVEDPEVEVGDGVEALDLSRENTDTYVSTSSLIHLRCSTEVLWKIRKSR
ncbi:hypothetical protein RRG08_048045 [Elysia crispata]|uniref:Uncharacterized protein n=1 Tax=Elysia crispata TaxID=231223 RepID=A0AAE0Z3X9_9GAST|nr:hypothetical protein RRG08_048045 [Elysia crispata]